MKLEQDIGRIGQDKAVIGTVNPLYAGTAEHDDYTAAQERIASFTKHIGSLHPILQANLERIIRDNALDGDNAGASSMLWSTMPALRLSSVFTRAPSTGRSAPPMKPPKFGMAAPAVPSMMAWSRVELRPDARPTPGQAIVKDDAIRREVVRQHTLGDASTQDLGRRQQKLPEPPFGASAVAEVRRPVHGPMLHQNARRRRRYAAHPISGFLGPLLGTMTAPLC